MIANIALLSKISIIDTILKALGDGLADLFIIIFKLLVVDFLGNIFTYFAGTAYTLIVTEGGFTTFDGLITFIQELVSSAHGASTLNATISAITIIILAINIVFCGLRIMLAPMIGKESESPQAFFTKAIVAVALIFSYKYITNFVVDFLNAFTHSGLFSIELNTEFSGSLFQVETTDLIFNAPGFVTAIGSLAVYLVLYIMLFKDLFFAAVIYIERYLSFAVYLLLGPICFAMYPNESTKNVTQEWLKGILSQIMVMVLSMFLFRIFFLQLSLMSSDANGVIGYTGLARGIVLIVLLNILKDSEQLVNMLGLRTIPSGDTARSFVQGLVGTYGTIKSAAGITKAIGGGLIGAGKVIGAAKTIAVGGSSKKYDKKTSTYINPKKIAKEKAAEQTTKILSDNQGKMGIVDTAKVVARNAKDGAGIVDAFKTVNEAKREYNGDYSKAARDINGKGLGRIPAIQNMRDKKLANSNKTSDFELKNANLQGEDVRSVMNTSAKRQEFTTPELQQHGIKVYGMQTVDTKGNIGNTIVVRKGNKTEGYDSSPLSARDITMVNQALTSGSLKDINTGENIKGKVDKELKGTNSDYRVFSIKAEKGYEFTADQNGHISLYKPMNLESPEYAEQKVIKKNKVGNSTVITTQVIPQTTNTDSFEMPKNDFLVAEKNDDGVFYMTSSSAPVKIDSESGNLTYDVKGTEPIQNPNQNFDFATDIYEHSPSIVSTADGKTDFNYSEIAAQEKTIRDLEKPIEETTDSAGKTRVRIKPSTLDPYGTKRINNQKENENKK